MSALENKVFDTMNEPNILFPNPKILVENLTISSHEINKLRQQFQEALHTKTKQKN